MKIYGICNIRKLNEKKIEQFFKEVEKTSARDLIVDYLKEKEEDPEVSFSEWVYDYESDSYFGLAAFLADLISRLEGIDINCDDTEGVHYLGLRPDVPWNLNEKTRNLTEKEYCEILGEYVSHFTDEELPIRWWYPDCDC